MHSALLALSSDTWYMSWNEVIAVLLCLGRAGRASGCCPSIEAKHNTGFVWLGSMLRRGILAIPFGPFPGEIVERLFSILRSY